jgi:hypothetical protein
LRIAEDKLKPKGMLLRIRKRSCAQRLNRTESETSLRLTVEACRRAGIVAVSARQLKPIKKLKLKLTTKSQIEFGQARY